MSNMIEIRWHGRGGQGAKTASLLLADAAFNTGKYIQGFPEYGPERMGAPITAYNRISDSEIRIHSNIYEPDYVVVVDDTLLEAVDVTAGLKETGAIVINTVKTAEELKPLLKGYSGKVYTIDARKVSEEALGKYFPNTPMLAAIVKVSGIMSDQEFVADMKESFKHKFAKKPEVIDGNMKAIDLALNEVKLFEEIGFFDLVISVKTFSLPLMIEVHKILSEKTDYPLHIGVTEAGIPYTGIIKKFS